MRNLKRLVAGTLTILGITLSGCTREKEAPSTPVPSPAQAKAFVPPTAEEAYRLQDDCTHRGEKILRENLIGIALAHEQVSRYNATTNKCYVRLEVHARGSYGVSEIRLFNISLRWTDRRDARVFYGQTRG